MTRESPSPRALQARAAALVPDWFGLTTKATLRADLMAGLTGATLVLPQGVAFAAIAGLPAEYGFYTAMVSTLVAALLGSSWHAVSGPTTALSIMLFATLSESYLPGSPEYVTAAITLCLMVGLIQLAFAVARLGALVDFVSHSVMTGFVTGAAILIALSQLRHVLGAPLPSTSDLGAFVSAIPEAALATDWHALIVALSAFVVGLAIKIWRPLWPNYLAALIVATGLSLTLGGAEAGIATIGPLGEILPSMDVPDLSLGDLREFGGGAMAIAIVGLLEALSVSRALALRSGQMIDGNREFLAQGLSNVTGSLFRCYPSSASFTRSGINYDAGARTPLSAIFSSVFLFGILLLVAPAFAVVPIPGIAGVIMLVAWRLIDFREIRHLVTSSSTETIIAGVTFATVLLVNLETAIYVGVLLSLGFFLRGAARPFLGQGAPDPSTPGRVFKHAAPNGLEECPQLMVCRLDGPLFFGSVEYLRREFRRLERERPLQRTMLFIVKGGGDVDLAGADLILDEARRRERMGGALHLQVKTPRTLTKLARFKVVRELGRERLHLSKGDAIALIVPKLDGDICATCSKRIFHECARQPGPPAK
ncbi:SulP family inorganic anion transporter [Salipiger sp. PrR002]|uniref:SulP family inorganic anion transporter n=1 Tax=Salipiger sp. PrR002 TaxID=2706489 RepID=UPI0013BDA7D2|nr:SulP family inorganic anion transporter [Salipiger sp. PrR002]NDW00089.1 SulP family inorganic anion transporter [Salipiger sp. PrR002]NDW56902.1 SulP family inorganic anion transporter [Salipiger sp. PrR004]